MKDNSLEEQLLAYLDRREALAGDKKLLEGELTSLDNEIKIFMIQNDVPEIRREDGLRMKIANGKNTTIIQKQVIDTLVELGFDPDQVKWFLKEVTQETAYDFVDMRKVKIDNE